VIKARIFDTHRMATGDGPGLRTTFFLKGCPLNCSWCHNPESISPAPEVWWFDKTCIGCGKCVESCPVSALILSETGIFVDRQHCTGCGVCTEVCPSGSMELLGREWSVEEALDYALKDKVFYQTSSGGVTLSGGEPSLYHDFCTAFLKRAREHSISTAFDTCGLMSLDILKGLIPLTDIFLWDIKTIDSDEHRKLTEIPNEVILSNLLYLADAIRENPTTRLWIRTPLIPGYTASEKNISEIASFISENLIDVIESWELCAFNGSCSSKYRRLGKVWELSEVPSMNEKDINSLKAVVNSFAPLSECTFFTGIINS